MKNVGVLLIHGFAGCRDEVRSLYDFLQRQEYRVVMPCLPGHEGSKKDLSGATHIQWIECVSEAYKQLSKECGKIIVIGFSMGGLLAVNLYQTFPYDKLITINTPIYYWDIKRIVQNLASDFKTYSRKYLITSTDKPFLALLQFQKLLTKTKPLFEKVLCPGLTIQTQDDDTVNPKSGDWIHSRLGGKKRLITLPKGGHVVLQSPYYREVLQVIDEEIKKADTVAEGKCEQYYQKD